MGKISKNELSESLATKIEEIDLKANISDLETTNTQLAQKANKQQQSWITPTLLNGWVDYSVNWKCGYYKDDMGIVRIRGGVKSGVTTQGTPIFTLPEGYRPSQNADYRTIIQDVVANVRIYTNGNVAIISGSATSLSLDGITFRAEG